MLRITIQLKEDFDEESGKFLTSDSVELCLEHSLVSLSKWESKWEKPFLSFDEKTDEQAADYIKMMILGEIPPEETLKRLSVRNIEVIRDYIEAKMTATWFSEKQEAKARREVVTAELIYYWMISLGIPFECQTWHLNRLLTLIKVVNIKNSPKQKINQAEAAASQRELNELRKRELGTRG